MNIFLYIMVLFLSCVTSSLLTLLIAVKSVGEVLKEKDDKIRRLEKELGK